MPAGLPGVNSVARADGCYVLVLADGWRPQTILRQLAATHDVDHFEVMRPTLHDIFVDIARPDAVAETPA